MSDRYRVHFVDGEFIDVKIQGLPNWGNSLIKAEWIDDEAPENTPKYIGDITINFSNVTFIQKLL